MLHTDIFMAWRFLKVIVWGISDTRNCPIVKCPKILHSRGEASKNIGRFMRKHICVSWNDFCFLKCLYNISFSFHIKHTWKRYWRDFLSTYFFDAYTVNTVPIHISMRHCLVVAASSMTVTVLKRESVIFNWRWTISRKHNIRWFTYASFYAHFVIESSASPATK